MKNSQNVTGMLQNYTQISHFRYCLLIVAATSFSFLTGCTGVSSLNAASTSTGGGSSSSPTTNLKDITTGTVATGDTVPTGDAVFLNSSGTVDQNFAPLVNFSSLMTLPSTSYGMYPNTYMRFFVSIDTTHFLQIYQDGNNSNSLTAVVCNAGSSVTCATPFLISASTSAPIDMAITGNTFLVAYQDSTNSSKGTLIACSTSGTCGSSVVFDASGSGNYSLSHNLAVGGDALVSYYDNTGGNPMLIAASISGTALSLGTAVIVTTGNVGNGNNYGAVEKLDATNFVIVSADATSGTTSGTTITLNTPVVVPDLNASCGSWAAYIVPLTATGFAIGFNQCGYPMSATISGTTLTLGTPVTTVTASTNPTLLDSTHLIIDNNLCTVSGLTLTCTTESSLPSTFADFTVLDSTHFLVYNTGTPNGISECIVSGTAVACSTTIGFWSSYSAYQTSALSAIIPLGSTSAALVTSTSLGSSKYASQAVLASTATLTLSSIQGSGIVGIAIAGADSGSDISISVGGSVGGYTGLTIGTAYYANGDGSITTNYTGLQMGCAISTTEILMNSNDPTCSGVIF